MTDSVTLLYSLCACYSRKKYKACSEKDLKENTV